MDSIEKFLSVGYGNGHGYGDGDGYGYGYGDGYGHGYGDGDGYGYGYGVGYGYGYGDGDGNGNGYGYGYGNGNGYGYGDGYGNGYGNGIIEFEGKKVYEIDDVPTILTSVHGNYAKGFTIKQNSVLVPCYVAKKENFFAHGENLHDAVRAVEEKWSEKRPLEDRIAEVKKKYPSLDSVVKNSELFSIHHILTGSCEFGRKQFIESQGISLDDSMTVREFIERTKNQYGSEAIEKLLEAYK